LTSADAGPAPDAWSPDVFAHCEAGANAPGKLHIELRRDENGVLEAVATNVGCKPISRYSGCDGSGEPSFEVLAPEGSWAADSRCQQRLGFCMALPSCRTYQPGETFGYRLFLFTQSDSCCGLTAKAKLFYIRGDACGGPGLLADSPAVQLPACESGSGD
jgi:hypothetical protein